METILLVIHALLALLLIIIVLIQRAEGGALGIGGGADGMTPRGAADALTRTTAIIATLFIITSIILVAISRDEIRETQSVLEKQEELDSTIPQIPESSK